MYVYACVRACMHVFVHTCIVCLQATVTRHHRAFMTGVGFPNATFLFAHIFMLVVGLAAVQCPKSILAVISVSESGRAGVAVDVTCLPYLFLYSLLWWSP